MKKFKKIRYKKNCITFNLSSEVLKVLKKQAYSRGVSLNQHICDILQEDLDKYEQDPNSNTVIGSVLSEHGGSKCI